MYLDMWMFYTETTMLVNIYINCFFAMCYVSLLLQIVSGTSWIKAKIYKNYTLNEDDGFTYPAKDRYDCILQCSQIVHFTCVGSYYNGNNGDCFHFPLTTLPRVRKGLPSDEMTILTRSVSAAFSINIPRPSAEGAANDCKYFGGHLMTLSEMHDFSNRGLSRCRCGWTADGVQRRISVKTAENVCLQGVEDCDTFTLRRSYCTVVF